VALALLREAGVPVAAPSANRFAGLSPTRAEHVRQSLGDRVVMILEGGSSEVGIESTVLSIAHEKPVLLRPGMVSREQLEAVIGPVGIIVAGPGDGAHSSPGLHRRHYSPATRVILTSTDSELPDESGALLYRTQPRAAGRLVPMPLTPEAYAATLYDTLHQLDAQGWPWIAIELPPDTPEWSAIRDRLTRAAAE
jgi:L-threonylcarbamoyladenylate synthase